MLGVGARPSTARASRDTGEETWASFPSVGGLCCFVCTAHQDQEDNRRLAVRRTFWRLATS